MKVTKTPHGTLITFGNKLNNKIKVLFGFEAVVYISVVFVCLFILYDLFSRPYPSAILGLFTFVIGIISAIAFWRYLKRIIKKENIFITADTFTIINKAITKKQEFSYLIKDISNFIYKGKATKTDHPLKGNSYDYLGFETQELVIAEVHNEGNLSFNYNGTTVFSAERFTPGMRMRSITFYLLLQMAGCK